VDTQALFKHSRLLRSTLQAFHFLEKARSAPADGDDDLPAQLGKKEEAAHTLRPWLDDPRLRTSAVSPMGVHGVLCMRTLLNLRKTVANSLVCGRS
jgi:hypothetical protein